MPNIVAEFLKDWRTTGTIAPSSRFLQRGLMDAVDFSHGRLVVELGPGTGCVTEAILKRLRPDAQLVAVEINGRFVAKLREDITDPRLTVVEGSAADLPAILARMNLELPSTVVSSLPFANLPPSLRDDIIRACFDSLPPGGNFAAFQYTPIILPKLLRRYFGNMTVRPVLLNIPPALIYNSVRRK